jgi:hypothetical protein
MIEQPGRLAPAETRSQSTALVVLPEPPAPSSAPPGGQTVPHRKVVAELFRKHKTAGQRLAGVALILTILAIWFCEALWVFELPPIGCVCLVAGSAYIMALFVACLPIGTGGHVRLPHDGGSHGQSRYAGLSGVQRSGIWEP